ncbi:MAG: winged helix-turn-helix domain-containing protein [Candidatus Spyradocola sp.]|jgi:uncharacterized protein YcaQ
MIECTEAQARRFLLAQNGLLGGHRFRGKKGVLQYVQQAGCVQFDPVDVCGRSADLSLLSRVQGYRKEMLEDLLYRERSLVDYFDKQLSILPTEDWPHFARMRRSCAEQVRSRQQIEAAAPQVLEEIAARGPLCSRDVALDEKTNWYWSDTRLARAVLEALYFRGDLVIHHKERNVKFYARAQDLLPEHILRAPDPLPDEADHRKWWVERRVGAVGLLWDRPSDAFLGMNLRAEARAQAFAALAQEGKLVPVRVEGWAQPLYARARDLPLLEAVRGGKRFAPRTEFLAPLDAMLWDRRLIEALFDFAYRWEIYTPADQRRYGYYVLPVLRGERFVGRIEAVRSGKALEIRRFWPEAGVRSTPALRRGIEEAAHRLCALNGLERVEDRSVPEP